VVGDRAVTDLVLQAWQYERETLVDYGVELQDFILHHDQDPVFTGYRWTAQLLLKDLLRVSYALNGTRDNHEMGFFTSRFTPALAGGVGETENRSLLLEAHSLEELQLVVRERMGCQNGLHRHSSVG